MARQGYGKPMAFANDSTRQFYRSFIKSRSVRNFMIRWNIADRSGRMAGIL